MSAERAGRSAGTDLEAVDISPDAPTPVDGGRWVFALTALLTMAATALMTRLWRADLTVPFYYEGDSVSSAAHVKATLENGWYEYQPDLGAPEGQIYHVFPFGDNLHLALMRLIPIDALQWPVVFNTYYLLAFPACALAALWFFRHVGLRTWTAVPLAVLFAVAPYHFVRSENHFFLAAYFTVPLALVPVMDAMRGVPLWTPGARGGSWTRWLTGRAALNALLLAAVGTATAYYAIFAVVLLAGAGVAGFLRAGSWRRLFGVVGATFFTLVVVVLNVLPDVLYTRSHPGAADAFVRMRGETEIYSLKLASLLLPAPGHPIPFLARVRTWYDGNYPLASELPALGAVAALALVLVILFWFVKLAPSGSWSPLARLSAAERHTVEGLSLLVLLAFLSATVGGFGTFVSFLTTSVRAWNRMAIFMSAILLAFLGLLLQAALAGVAARRSNRQPLWGAPLRVGAATLVLLAGVFDQSIAGAVPPYAASQDAWRSDEAFVRDLEARLPDRAMLFQVPYVAFPESGMDMGVFDSDQLRLSLHSTRLRWSGGAFKGQPTTQWQGKVSGMTAAQAAPLLAGVGFSGVVIDRNATRDGGVALASSYTAASGPETFASPDGRWVYVSLARASSALQVEFTAQDIAALRDRVLRADV